MSSESIFIDPEWDRDLRARGFTTVPLLRAEEVETLREGLAQLLERHRIVPGSGAELREGHCSYSHVDAGYRGEVGRLVRSVIAPAVTRILNGYRTVAGGVFVKAPGAGEMGVHLDPTPTPDPDVPSFTFWCPLVDVGPANGAMCMLPGSHKVAGHIAGPGMTPFFDPYRQRIRRQSVHVSLPAGHALVSDTRMVHWSLANRSDYDRPAVHCVCIPQSSRHAIHLLDDTQGLPRFRIYDLTDAEAVGTLMSYTSLPSLGERRVDNPKLGWRDLKRLVTAAKGCSGEPRPRWRMPFLAAR